MITTLDMIYAFDDCFRNKRSSGSAVLYEAERMIEDLPRLARELNERTYEPDRSIVFIVRYPRLREVFAADFRDRIVHHWMCLRIEPLLEAILLPRRFNCRKGKGTLAAVSSLRADIKEVSRGFTADCWVAKCDIRGFFMSIDRQRLADITDRLITERYHGQDKEDLRWVSRKIVMHSPEKHCIYNSPKFLWELMPKEKSLFTNGEDMGLPIGNLPSQTLANLYLHCALDSTLDRIQGEARCSGIDFRWNAYVDDTAMVCNDKAYLLSVYPRIRESLAKYGLRLNERKDWVQHYSKSVQFLGQMIRLGKCYPLPRAARRLRRSAETLCQEEQKADISEVAAMCASVNARLGLMIHHGTYRMRRKALWKAEHCRRCCLGKDYEKVVIKKKYSITHQTRRRVSASNPWALCLANKRI